jgi:hypothetical protein
MHNKIFLYFDTGTVALLVLFACYSGYRAWRVLFRLKPARARVLYNGFVRERAKINAAILHKERAPMPVRTPDRIVFEDEEGNPVHADLNRWASNAHI